MKNIYEMREKELFRITQELAVADTQYEKETALKKLKNHFNDENMCYVSREINLYNLGCEIQKIIDCWNKKNNY